MELELKTDMMNKIGSLPFVRQIDVSKVYHICVTVKPTANFDERKKVYQVQLLMHRKYPNIDIEFAVDLDNTKRGRRKDNITFNVNNNDE